MNEKLCICGNSRKRNLRRSINSERAYYKTCGNRDCIKNSKSKSNSFKRSLFKKNKKYYNKKLNINYKKIMSGKVCIDCDNKSEIFEIRCKDCINKIKKFKRQRYNHKSNYNEKYI